MSKIMTKESASAVPESTESQLIARVLAGDRLAARELYDAHAPRIYRLTFRIAGDPDLAEEFTQDTFVKAFTKLSQFRGDASLATWLHTIAVTVSINGIRKLRRRRAREADIEVAASIGASDRLGQPDLRDRLAAAIEALPEKLRITVVLHDIEGFTHPEIAEMTGVPEGTCKTRLAGGRARLREALSAFAS